MAAFIEAEELERLSPGKGVMATTGNNTVAIFKADDGIHAIEAWCLHCGASLAEGSLDGSILACSGCDWRYDVRTGSVVGIPALRLTTFDAKLGDGKICIEDA